MDLLKKLFPFSFGTKEVSHLVVRTIIYILAVAVGTVLLSIIGILTGIPLVGPILATVLGVIGGLLDLYCLVGIVLLFLAHFNVLK